MIKNANFFIDSPYTSIDCFELGGVFLNSKPSSGAGNASQSILYITKMSYILERRILLELLFDPKNKAHPNIQKISIIISNTQKR